VRPTLREIAWLVLRDVNRTVGGGNAAMELLRRSFVARNWLTDSTHAVVMAVSRVTPGTNILAYCTAVGWMFRGWQGSAAALAAASVPSSILIFAFIAVLTRALQYRAVQAAMAVGLLVACYLVLASAWMLLRPYVRGPMRRRVFLVAIAAVTLYVAGMTPVRILLLSAVVGFLFPPGGEPAPPQPAHERGDARAQVVQ
jgi:chromate transporter